MRIEEPFLKGHLALWLAAKGATEITVSVDGAEPHPQTIRQVLTYAGYSHQPSRRSSAEWTGRYMVAEQIQIVVVSRPGIDVDAVLPGGQRCVAECKGEPTPGAVKAGLDRTAFHTGLGQLIMAAGAMSPAPDVKILAVPNTPRLSDLARKASRNRFVQDLGISVVLVDATGQVTEV